MNVIDLQEIAPDSWKAKYRGNYGIYTIKIKKDGNKTIDFSCTCPSDYYPCKHIRIIEDAIRERIAKKMEQGNKQEKTIEQLLKDVSQNKLYDFVVKQAQYNPQLKNEILLEFAQEMDKNNANSTINYNQILSEALAEVYFDHEDIGYYDYGYDDCIEIDVLNQWLNKARNYVDMGNPNEALAICKACIEEYAEWYEEQEDYIAEWVSYEYQEGPFDILNKIINMQEIDKNALQEYCKAEMLKPKYKHAHIYDSFNNLFLKLSSMLGSDDYIALQDKLLKELGNNDSYEAEQLMKQKIGFYRNSNQPDKAWEVIKSNLQIESFRKEWVKKLIEENNLKEAKQLIREFFIKNEKEDRYFGAWYEISLQIAQKENNISEIRAISYQFIKSQFKEKYYAIYKSTFVKEVWAEEVEKLMKHYEKKYQPNWFNDSIADVLKTEKQKERLMNYIEKYLSVDCLENYYSCFSSSFPEKTLALFKKAIDKYAQNNTGRDHYERIVKLFKKMLPIEGGKELVSEMITQYRMLYKNRKAMMEIINKNF